ncbi:hypothetical protein H310_14727 [Aphanomyces invadans]|uniref:Sugar phosphate transporter domain-containing protein n=1 Tax=Aphanomyces invadans TaxID=157072 RepID=A0A024T929_9STRA|nr:hypothetical protein H310_14727 [Aphanomyces invadans]ETV90484.1 hypothetical protein H310_14727 [Aphanomyces invadans]|eukprot:XP_008880872.1 hypothetical protein H310_14727 [Aphanomyces invadans]
MGAAAPLAATVKVKALCHALWPCALYLCLSLSMNIFTKTIITTYNWNAVYSLAAIQHLFTVVLVSAAHKLHLITLPSMSASCFFRTALPMAALHSANNIVGFMCMGLVNMPMYLVLRRLTTFKVMLLEILWRNQVIPDAMKASLLLAAVGSLVAGFNDATYNGYGYVLVVAQNCCTAMNLILAKQSNLSPLALVYVHSTAGLALCGPVALFLERDRVTAFFSTLTDIPSFCGLFASMSVVCLMYQVAIHLCTVRTSPLATSVTGNIKDLASTAAGYLLFADVVVTRWNVMGVALSFVGAYGFSYTKYHMLFAPTSAVLRPWWRPTLSKRPPALPAKPKAF